jgi:hypothetical protein
MAGLPESFELSPDVGGDESFIFPDGYLFLLFSQWHDLFPKKKPK